MKYNQLNVKANRSTRRLGRGIAAGQGKTAGRGTKGQGARTGAKKKPIFQGGSRSIVSSVPKLKGFKSRLPRYQIVYLDNLNHFADKTIDNFFLFEQGYIKTPYAKTKVITRGEISVAVNLQVQAVSKNSAEMIQKAGGTVKLVDTPLKEANKEKQSA